MLLLSASAAPARAAADAGAQAAGSLTTPMWVLVIGVLVALAAMVGILVSVINLLTAKPAKVDTGEIEFARTLCERVWTHTDTVERQLGQRLRNHPATLPMLQIQVRNLREDLSDAALYVDYMKAYSASGWPSAQLFSAYSAWAGLVRAMEVQLADLFDQLSRPLVQEPVDKDREKRLIEFYENEQRVLNRGIDKMRAQASRISTLACEFIKRGRSGSGLGSASANRADKPDCPCCSRIAASHAGEPVLMPLPDVVIQIEPPAKAPAPPPSAPPPPSPPLHILAIPYPAPAAPAPGVTPAQPVPGLPLFTIQIPPAPTSAPTSSTAASPSSAEPAAEPSPEKPALPPPSSS